MSCLDLLRQQACDMREESNAATEKYKKSVERGRATTVEEGWELLSQLNMSKRKRTQRRYSMVCSGTLQSSRVTGANVVMHNGHATGPQFAGTPYQRPVGSMRQGFHAPRAPIMPQQQQPRMPQYLPAQRQTLSSSPAQWTRGNAVPHGVNVQQHHQPTPKMPISGALSQGPASHQAQTMQRRMPSQQQQLAISDSGYWKNTNARPNSMTLQRGTIGHQHQMLHAEAHFVASNQVRPPAQHQFTNTINATPSYTDNGGHSSVFHTPNATPIGMRNQNQFASDPLRLQRFAGGNSSAQQNNPHQGMYHADTFNRPTSKPANSWSAATGQQAMPRNNAYVAQPHRQAVDASEFFSLSEQELDEVLASLADSKTTSQHKTPSTNATFPAAPTGQLTQFIPLPGTALMEHPSGAASGYGTVTNASQGNAPMATSTLPATGAQAIHISVPAGTQVLEIRESSTHSGAYEVVTTVGTFTAYGQAPVVDQQPQRQPQHHQSAP